MKHSSIALMLTALCLSVSIFSMWFFPFNGVTLLGSILGTGFIVVGSLFAFIANLFAKEGN